MAHTRSLAGLTIASILACASIAHGEASHHSHVLPERADTAAYRASNYQLASGWLTSDVQTAAAPGYRVAAMIESSRDVAIEARGVDERGNTGLWQALEITFRGNSTRVAVVDLDVTWPAAQIRIAAADDGAIASLSWELVEPRYPQLGAHVRQLAEDQPLYRGAGPSEVDAELAALGVISRAQWGARPTGCSATENDWYRMAIHHTAGPQTQGGSVQEVVRGVQAYAQDSGNYCDIPYQYMVGYDGTLWEGRPPQLQSGATGGGNNDGNLAICFMGCYHPSGCPTGVPSVPTTEEMIGAARALAHTLSRLHNISMAADNVRGHREWPGNSTACPGDFVVPRLGDIRTEVAWFAAEPAGQSFPDQGPLTAEPGQTVELWVDMKNTGGLVWQPGLTFLAPSPRDETSVMNHSTWPSPTRAATVDGPVSPGAVGRFSFQIQAPTSGEPVTQSFTLVQEGVTWFADAPRGGGPGDDTIVIQLGEGDGPDPELPDPTDPDDPDLAGGCSAANHSGQPLLPLLLVILAALVRRTR